MKFSWYSYTSTLKLHGVFGDEPKEDPRWSHQPALMMSYSMMTEQQKKAVFKIVRRSLKGLRNEAPSQEDEARRSAKLVHLNLLEPRLWSLEMERKLLNRHVKFYQVSRCIGRAQLYVIRVLMVTNNKSQMQQKKLSSSCSPSDASQTRLQVPSTNRITDYKSQVTTLHVSNYKLRRS